MSLLPAKFPGCVTMQQRTLNNRNLSLPALPKTSSLTYHFLFYQATIVAGGSEIKNRAN